MTDALNLALVSCSISAAATEEDDEPFEEMARAGALVDVLEHVVAP